jgi:hypothetical protein
MREKLAYVSIPKEVHADFKTYCSSIRKTQIERLTYFVLKEMIENKFKLTFDIEKYRDLLNENSK